MRGQKRTALHSIRSESGQSLVIVALCMLVVMGVAAFGVDVATWYQKHHQAQVVADAAALAAANCLAKPNTGPTGYTCNSSTDVTDAQNVAVYYAAQNGLTLTASQVSVDTTTDQVTINASSSAPSLFARLFGVQNSNQSAAAAASWSGSAASCSTPGTGCDFMFANNSNCASSSNGISLTMSGTTTINGEIQSNSNISAVTSGNISLGTGTYGPNGSSTCSSSTIYSGKNPWANPPTQESVDLPWPIDYAKDFPACGGTGELACASNGYPSFCTNEGASITLTGGNGGNPISGNIYCAIGGGTKSIPSTWNGTVTITASGSSTTDDTFVGGTINYTVSGTTTLSPCGYTATGYTAANCNASVPTPVTGNYPIFYATGTSSTALNITISGSQAFNGDMFAPNGTAHLTWSGNKTVISCIEANNISGTVSGTFEGDGPVGGTTGGGSGGTDALIQ